MNFTQEIKRELVRKIPKERDCQIALLHAAFEMSGGSLIRANEGSALHEIFFTSENEEVAGYFLTIFETLFGRQMTLKEAVRDPKHGRDKLTFSYEEPMPPEVADTIFAGYREGEETDIAYLRGAFLSGGSCTLPREGKKTGYHLEFVFEDEDSAQLFREYFERVQLISNVVVRGEKHVVYLKSREAISDFLGIVGAEGALRTLESVSSAREERNNENRRENCYAGNADKAAIASAAQVVSLGKLERSGRLAALPEPLKAAAEARLGHPELSLSELAELLGVTKSCLNHRLRKLMSLSNE